MVGCVTVLSSSKRIEGWTGHGKLPSSVRSASRRIRSIRTCFAELGVFHDGSELARRIGALVPPPSLLAPAVFASPASVVESIAPVPTVPYVAPAPSVHTSPEPMVETSRQRQRCNTGASGKFIVPAPVMEYQRQWSTSHQRQPFPF